MELSQVLPSTHRSADFQFYRQVEWMKQYFVHFTTLSCATLVVEYKIHAKVCLNVSHTQMLKSRRYVVVDIHKL